MRGSSGLKQSDVVGSVGKYPVYGAAGFINNVDFYHQEKPYVAVVKDGAGIGRAGLYPAYSSVIGTMQYLIPKNNVLPEYLFYVVKYMHLEKYFSGATIPHIYFKDYKNEEFNLETIEKQKEIVDILGKVEHTIQNRKKQLDKLDALIKSRFVEMFGDPIINPMGWPVVTVKDIVSEVKYGTSKPAVNGGKYPYLRMNNLTSDGSLDLTDLKYIDIDDNELEKYVVRKGDVLFNRTNSIDLIGKTATFDLDQEMIIAGYIIRVRLKDLILAEFFTRYMNLDPIKIMLKNIAKGAVNQANINAQELQNIQIYLPDIERQKQFKAEMDSLNKSR